MEMNEWECNKQKQKGFEYGIPVVTAGNSNWWILYLKIWLHEASLYACGVPKGSLNL